jgi:hypothetical protein
MVNYIVTGFAIVLGFLLVLKTEWFVQTLGASAWAEQHMGTRLYYKLIGVLFIVGSILLVTGALGDFFLSFFGHLFGI